MSVKPGVNGSPSAVQLYPAEVAAKKMEKKMKKDAKSKVIATIDIERMNF